MRLLKLMQLADSALPIGSAAHSFGLESLISEELLNVDALAGFLHDYLGESGVLEGAFCRAVHKTGAAQWTELNQLLSARKPARESRLASLALGRRFMQLFLALEGGYDPGGEAHYCTAFGYASRALGIDESVTVSVYLHQSMSALVSACQRLMPLGQQRAARLLWDLKPAIVDATRASDVEPHAAGSFTPLVEVASMRHVALATRLFIS
ncbi:MAG: ureF [Bryobacterales bacterium]|nr:ureF [Bryobacterales bacterium]